MELLGIVFTGGEGPQPQVIRRLIDEEVKDKLLVAADSGLAAVESAGLKPDWIIGDMDSLDDESRLDAYPPERVIRHQPEKDYTDTELAFSLAVENDCDEMWIIGGGGGRIDHLFAIRSIFERDIYPCRWVTDAADIYCIDADTAKNKLSLSLKKGSPVSLFPLGNGPWEAESGGLKWPLKNLHWDRGFFGISNAASYGDFFIEALKGKFMVILPEMLCLL